MKKTIQSEQHGEILYEESFWTGKKEISINGNTLTKTSKKSFQTENGQNVYIEGNFFSGAKIAGDLGTFPVSPSIKWYELVLAVIPFILIMVWGNSVTLCEIIPVVGGAIGGAISGLFSVVGLLFMKQAQNIGIKILIGIAAIGVTFLICFLIGLAIVSAL